MRPPRAGRWRCRWRLLEDRVDIGAADPERAHPGQPGSSRLPRPGAKRGVDDKRAAGEVDRRVGSFQVQAGRDLAVPQHQRHLDQPGDAGGRVQMSDVALDRADQAVAHPVGAAAVRAGQRLDLDRVTQRRTGTVRFHIVDLRSAHPGEGQRLSDHLSLAGHARRGVADPAVPVVVECRAPDHRVDLVAVGHRRGQRLEHHHPDPVAGHGPAGPVVERPAMPVPGQDHALLPEVPGALRHRDPHRAGQRHRRLPREQALAGQVHRCQPGRAGGVDGHALTAQSQQVRHPGGEVLAGSAAQRLVLGGRVVGELAEQGEQVSGIARAGVHRDRFAHPLRVVAGVLQRRPGSSQEHPLLRVQPPCLAWRQAEELMVEPVGIGQHCTRRHEVGIGPQPGRKQWRVLQLRRGEP